MQAVWRMPSNTFGGGLPPATGRLFLLVSFRGGPQFGEGGAWRRLLLRYAAIDFKPVSGVIPILPSIAMRSAMAFSASCVSPSLLVAAR